jgi:RNA polymerase sigma factor (sigma-70 family)
MRVYAPQLRSRNDDAALVRRLQSGDERAFEEIFKRHRTALLSYCRHMLSNRDEGEDALQQTFVKAHRSLLGGTAPRELRPWLYAIARNCCLTAIAARRPTAQLQEQTPSFAGLSEEVSRREDLRELVAGIGRLPEDQRSALLLSELDDLSHAAIAAIVGCEVSKVKALVYQARSSLLADRDALGTPCLEIREQLSVARGGELRRGPLRRHLRLCEGCRDFQLALGAQRQSLALVLPVAPGAGLAVAILGHGAAAHTAAAAAGIGHASGVGVGATSGTGLGGSGAAGATGTAGATGAAATGGAGFAASGATGLAASGAGGGAGLAASGAGATTTALGAGAGTSIGVGASAGAGGGAGIGALLGGGLVTKLAVGGAVVVLAAAGAATVHNREAHASPRGARGVLRAQLAATEIATETGGDRTAAEIADSSSALVPGSPTTALAVATDGTGPGDSLGLASLAEPAGLDSSDPLFTSTGALMPGGASAAGSPATPAASNLGAAGSTTDAQGKGVSGSALAAARAERRAALRRRRELLRRTALLRRKAELRRERALLRRERAQARRSRRKALKSKHAVKPPAPAPAPVVTPAPVHTHRHKAHTPTESTPAQSSTSAETTGTGTGSKSKAASGTGTGMTGEETTGDAPTKPHSTKHPVEPKTESPTKTEQPSKEEKPTKEAQSTESKEAKNKEAQPTNLRDAPEVTGVDVHSSPTQTQTGGTHNASS